jgi:hypothetical protein
MGEAEVGTVVRGLRRSLAILAAVLPAVGQQRRAVNVALEAMDVLYPGRGAELEDVPDLDQVAEWVLVGRGSDGREIVGLTIPKLNRESRVGGRRSRANLTNELVESEFDSVAGERRDVSAVPVRPDGSAEPVEIRALSEWALAYLREHEGEHFSVRRLREQALGALGLLPEQLEHDRFRLALIEARTQDPALAQPNRKAWMYRRGMQEPRSESAE